MSIKIRGKFPKLDIQLKSRQSTPPAWVAQDYTTVTQIGTPYSGSGAGRQAISNTNDRIFTWGVGGTFYMLDINESSISYNRAISTGSFSGGYYNLRSVLHGDKVGLSNGWDGSERVRIVKLTPDKLDIDTYYSYSANSLPQYYNWHIGVAISDSYIARGFNPQNSSAGTVYITDHNLNSVRNINCPPYTATVTYADGQTGSINPRTFGSGMALYGDTVFISGYTSGFIPGSITNQLGLIFVYSITTGNLLSIIKPPTTSDGQRFGKDMFISGDKLIVGTENERGEIFVYNADTYLLERRIQSGFNVGLGDNDRMSVAVYGNYCAMGLPLANSNNGLVKIFNINTGALLETLTPAESSGQFGGYVSMYENTLVVASHGNSFNIHAYKLS